MFYNLGNIVLFVKRSFVPRELQQITALLRNCAPVDYCAFSLLTIDFVLHANLAASLRLNYMALSDCDGVNRFYRITCLTAKAARKYHVRITVIIGQFISLRAT
jgi:hypothetical protein